MTVSLVIPVHNEEEFIERCHASVFRQVVKPDEIIVVDNNCTDKTISIVKNFPVAILKEPKQGITHARNRGFNAASGDLIVRTDADAIVPTSWIKRVRENFETKNIDALCGHVTFYDVIGKQAALEKAFITVMHKLLGHYPMIGPNMALTADVWQKIKGEVCLDDAQVHEDIDLSIHIHKTGGVIGHDPRLKVKVSGRRIKYNPRSFFIEYPLRFMDTIKAHQQKD